MIDDFSGLYSHASDAYCAGRRVGRDDFYNAVILALGRIGMRHASSSLSAEFHAVGGCTKTIGDLKQAADGPQVAI